MDMAKWADPFYGNFEPELPPAEGIAARWFFLKAQTGNTHPGACRPFGMVSACAYTGGYSSGYSPYWFNSHSRPPRVQEPQKRSAYGFSHFHHSGTGAIGRYYNFVIVTPTSCPAQRGTMFPLTKEEARLGWYACKLGTVSAELTVARMSAIHRYRFADAGTNQIAVDLRQNGLRHGEENHAADGVVLDLALEPGAVSACVQYDGIKLYTAVICPPNAPAREEDGRVLFDLSGQREAQLFIGFSLASAENALLHAREAESGGFDACAGEAYNAFNRLLSAVEIDAPDEMREKFYSNFYHMLLKPCDITGDSPFWNDSPCWCDISTMWDLYKIQLPLVCTLYPQTASQLINALLGACQHFGYFPNYLLLAQPDDLTANQARALAYYTIYDAYVRRVPDVDYRHALAMIQKDFARSVNDDFKCRGEADTYPTQTWDLAGACFAAGLLAHGLGEADAAAEFFRYAKNWRNVLDKDSGLIRPTGTFYEGTHWNYSFRLLPWMAERIGDPVQFIENLDAFFGYRRGPVTQNLDPANLDGMRSGEALCSFEGFNNETDIETPYAYLYAGRHDRTAEICREGMRQLFGSGQGALCGNDDSGGLGSLYVANTIGLFPASGLPYLLIGSPCVRESRTTLANGVRFVVRCENFSENTLYVASAQLNGQPLDRAWLSIDEWMEGGTLVLTMSEQPTQWAAQNPPPSGKQLLTLCRP